MILCEKIFVWENELNKDILEREIVGYYNEEYNLSLNISLPSGNIFLYSGFKKHIRKRHKSDIKYIKRVSEIIKNPDYVGKHKDIPNSIEFYKRFDKNVLVSVNLDIENNYLYVSSLYNVKQSKIDIKMHSGNCIKIT